MSKLQKVTPFLWFDTQAEDAAKFYTSVFPNSKILGTTRYGDAGPGPKGSVMTVAFELDGLQFTALNGGPQYQFSGAVSFVVNCETQDEVDHYWERLSEGGQQIQCGWLTDRFGMTWQVVPTVLPRLLLGGDATRAHRVITVMMGMKKLDIAALENA